MDYGTILGILGLTATVVFGWLSIYFVIKHRYPGQVTFVVEDMIPLFDSIVKNFAELSVLYKGKPVSEGLVLLKGAFVNTGKKDITKEMTQEPLTLRLPDGYRWHSVKLVSASPAIHGKFTFLHQVLSLEVPLFRCGEAIRFEAVAEVPVRSSGAESSSDDIKTKFESALKPSHRIADTQRVKEKTLPDERFVTKRFKRMRLCAVGMFLAIVVLVTANYSLKPTELAFAYPSGGGRTLDVHASPKPNGNVVLKGIHETAFRKEMTVEQFIRTPDLSAKCVPDRRSVLINTFGGSLNIAIILVALAFSYRDIRQLKRLRKLLSSAQQAAS